MKRNKKGFTLIEMMVVIAIIAVLTAVIIPVVGNSTAKAAAATNAANLRSVEGELTAMMLIDPQAFDAWTKSDNAASIDQENQFREETYGSALEALEKDLADAEAALAAFNERIDVDAATAAVTNYQNQIKELNVDGLRTAYETEHAAGVAAGTCKQKSFLGLSYWEHSSTCEPKYNSYLAAVAQQELISPLLGEAVKYLDDVKEELSNLEKNVADAKQAIIDAEKQNQTEIDNNIAEKEAMYTYTAVDGYITLDNGTKIKAPGSQEMDFEGVSIEDDVQMVVYVDAANRIFKATYTNKENTEYNKDDFAAVAGESEAE